MSETSYPNASRNEPCPCGSGKKFKKCHGEDARPRFDPRALAQGQGPGPGAIPGMPAGMDPNANPAMMNQVMSAFQRLPKAQMLRLQGLMQKAMAGKDVTREAAELERMLPPHLQQMMISMMGAMGMAAQNQNEAANLSEEEARKIVEQAAQSGKISADQATELLGQAPKKENRVSKLWKGLLGK